MKKITINLMIILFAISGLLNNVLAQAPEGIIYQAEARDSKGNPITNQTLDVKISIIQDIPAGSVVYAESHIVTTNDFGMFVLVIGQGTNTLGLLLENVDWGNHNHFLNVQVKKTKATVWINMGTSQLLSVPYALHAKTATEAFTADYNFLYNVPQNISHFNNDTGYLTGADNTDPDPTNEIQDLQLVDNILTITKNGNATQIDLSFYSEEIDPVFTASEAAKIRAEDITNLSNLSGINTGDQDLSGLATTADLDNKVDKVAGKELFPNGTAPGQMKYWNGTEWVNVAPGTTGQVLTFFNGKPTWKTQLEEGEVENPTTGKIWMDRDLGASQVATSSTDAAAYGDLYQWGRATDGHEKRNSGTSSVLSNSDTPGHGNFILESDATYDWRSPQNNNLWQGVNGINNPCPNGYRLPTATEWDAERTSWSSNNASGAFASPLKLSLAGNRWSITGQLLNVGIHGSYWSSTVSGIASRCLFIFSNSAYVDDRRRSNGDSVRCIKD